MSKFKIAVIQKTDVTMPTKLGGSQVEYIGPSSFGYMTACANDWRVS